MNTRTLLGPLFAGIYILVCAYLIFTQGLFGESFIALILGLPWSLAFAYFEFGNATGALLYVMLLAPLFLNAFLLYAIGKLIGKRFVR